MTRLGAIDAGTNAIRAVIADASDPRALTLVEHLRLPVRLGRGTFTRGEIDAAMLSEAVDGFERFAELFEQHGVERYRAVATSAVRTAHNRDALLHRIYHEAGIDLEVIDGEEEARLVRKAVVHAFAERPPPRMVLDLGGGSLEVNYHDGASWRGVSLPVGTVRLLETFGLTGVIGADEAGMVRRYAGTLLQAFAPPVGRTPAAVCGGNAEALARLFGDTDATGMPGFDLGALEAALPELLAGDVDTRMQRFGLRRDRAEVIGVAALVLATVCRALQLTRLAVPGVGIRDALLLDLAEGIADEQAEVEKARGKALLTAARTFAGRMGHDIAHGEQVRRMARTLFDQLGDLHRLPEELGSVLEVAAVLHDVGEVLNARSHHKHSAYMILWGRIPGLESPHREMVAALARTHRKSPPDPKKHEIYAQLTKPQRAQVRTLGAILRVADALDTDHRQSVARVLVTRLGKDIALDLVLHPGRSAPEPATLLRKSALFEAEFGHRVTLTVGPPPT
ncbi:Ppx/GppA phosphatase family protein [Haliangium ochraceum]|uniref:Ppx/GppA phosphatase n=1 Tax=Haliangium ochraceum (strain DSM 14365 / JCM 11303 / SMP-2) TaxID=502025 RepID=D0LW87_HALO1|nr:Ppx/GppA phosphatase family protein [Haliangium ochraceum]ACY16019.1 Ppx/GppA phosphatase [Haliangium ochraceum DSM 14365]